MSRLTKLLFPPVLPHQQVSRVTGCPLTWKSIAVFLAFHIGYTPVCQPDNNVHNQQAPLLLGQSALERFGVITIDNINSKLIIKDK